MESFVPCLGEKNGSRPYKRLRASPEPPVSGSCCWSSYLNCPPDASLGVGGGGGGGVGGGGGGEEIVSCLRSVEQALQTTTTWGDTIQAVTPYGVQDPGAGGAAVALGGLELEAHQPNSNSSRRGVWGCESGASNSWAADLGDMSQCDTAATGVGWGAEDEFLFMEYADNPYSLLQDQQRAYEIIYRDLADMISNMETPSSSSRPDDGDSPCFSVAAPRTPAVCECVRANEQDCSEDGRWGGRDDAPPYPPSPPSMALLAEEGGSAADQARALEALTDSLMECGEALLADDGHRTSEVVSTIQQHSTPEGNPLQRLAHYYALALVARLNATGADLHSAIRRRDQHAVVEAEKVYDTKDPTAAVAHHFSTAVFLDALEGAEQVHIVDYGISSGQQWHALMQALAYRPQGPPRLRITGLELPQPGLNPTRQTGRKLSRLAANLGIPFRYKALTCKWESVNSTDLDLRDDEVLAVCCMFQLRNLLDDSVVLSNPRRTVLEKICSMRPRVFFTAELSLAANAPFLITRLRESIPASHSFFDALDSNLPRDSADRRLIEEEILGRDILNMIACEGADRIERPEGYHQWHRRLLNAGFQQLPLEAHRFDSTRDMLHGYHDDWTIGRDQGWILTGWKGRVHHAYAAWKPA